MLDELNIVVFGEVALTIVSYSIHHSYTKILYSSEKILVTDQISPDSAAIG